MIFGLILNIQKMFLNQRKPKNDFSNCSPKTVLQLPVTVYCLTLSDMARMEMGYNLKKLANFFKFSLLTDQVFGPESTLDTRFFHKNLSQIFLTLTMASAQVDETSFTKHSPSQDSNHPDYLFQSKIFFSCLKKYITHK